MSETNASAEDVKTLLQCATQFGVELEALALKAEKTVK
jgi:hypothetical protein